MRLVERHAIRKQDEEYEPLLAALHLSKNLYNATLYHVRQEYILNQKYSNYYECCNQFTKERNPDFCALPAKVAQQTMKMVDKSFRSFFGLLKARKDDSTLKPKLPRYLDKTGYYLLTYTDQALSTKKSGYIKPSGLDVYIKTSRTDIKQLRVLPPVNDTIYVELVYEVQEKEALLDNHRYMSIDLGVNNLAAVGYNCGAKPLIINGRPLKSINQFYNKRVAGLKSKLPQTQKSSHRIKSITQKRNNKIKDYMHKASRFIISQAVDSRINTIIIGKNEGWKQEINIGSRNNQNFTGIPHSSFIQMIEYKAKLAGIQVVVNEESYTSKCSYLDREKVCKHDEYLGRRIKRGLFKSSSGRLINADINGAFNIMRKAVGDAFSYPIEACSPPMVYTISHKVIYHGLPC